jgi:hypothetical protein
MILACMAVIAAADTYVQTAVRRSALKTTPVTANANKDLLAKIAALLA